MTPVTKPALPSSDEKMNPSDTWAETAWVMRSTERVFGERPRTDWRFQPGLQVQAMTGASFIAGGPTEHFSKKMPTRQASRPGEGDLLPIDELYGIYCAADRRIEIYVDRIRQDAKLFGAEPEDLIYLVRLHEYGHAVTHLGISDECADPHLSTFGDTESTDWSTYTVRRDEYFMSLPEGVHELLAQTITYDAIGRLPADVSARLRSIFAALEEKQPEIYKVPREIKVVAGKIDWPLVLDAARGEIGVSKTEGFDPVLGIKSLVCRSSKSASSSSPS